MAASASQTLRSVLNDFVSDVGKEDYSISHLEEALTDFDITKIPTDQIYRETMLSRFRFQNGYNIKILEETVDLTNKQKDIYLLSRDAIRRHQSKYNFLHVGLVQVSIGVLHRRGINTTVLICLRDAKYPNLKDSILAAFESSMYDGVTKFNWFPNISSPLSDLAKSNGLVVTIEPQGYELSEGCEDSHILTIKYRMCYKLMKKSLEPKSHFGSPVIELNTDKTSVFVPKSINRNGM